MSRRINLSQLKSKLRQWESKQRQAINQTVRKHNEGVRKLKRAIDRYNQEVRSYNSRQRRNNQRLQSELRRLQSQPSTSFPTLRRSVTRLNSAYTRLEHSAAARVLAPADNYFLDLAEREAANSAEVVNALITPGLSQENPESLQHSCITDELAVISQDLDTRWRGALFALNPANPDAARHFCTSSREIFTQIFDIKAPDEAVFAAVPDAQRTERGNATRRSKIAYLLLNKGVQLSELAEFANEDIANVLELFEVLNTGTHGRAGTYDLTALAAIKRRIEDGLIFLSTLAA